MRQRALTQIGDYSFGSGLPFLVNTPECVAQAIMTRLRLATGEWFLDKTEGTPYQEQILGHSSEDTRDLAIRRRILDTPGVLQIAEYLSFLDTDRSFVVVTTIDTLYGSTTITAAISP